MPNNKKQETMEWIKITDELPDDWGAYWVCTDSGDVEVTHFDLDEKEFPKDDYLHPDVSYTHWMGIEKPEPPTGQPFDKREEETSPDGSTFEQAFE